MKHQTFSVSALLFHRRPLFKSFLFKEEAQCSDAEAGPALIVGQDSVWLLSAQNTWTSINHFVLFLSLGSITISLGGPGQFSFDDQDDLCLVN